MHFRDTYPDLPIFITENGKASERLLGIITPWDIAALSKETRCYAGLARASRQ